MSEWIKTSERLPDFGEIVWLSNGQGSLYAGARSEPDEKGWVWEMQTRYWRLCDPDGLDVDDVEPRFWMPMQSLPE